MNKDVFHLQNATRSCENSHKECQAQQGYEGLLYSNRDTGAVANLPKRSLERSLPG